MEHDFADHKKPPYRCIYVPTPLHGPKAWRARIPGIVLTSGTIFTLLWWCVAGFLASIPGSPWPFYAALGCVSIACGLPLSNMLANQLRIDDMLRRRTFRTERLKTIVSKVDSVHRLPHRHVEMLMRSRFASLSTKHRIAERLNPGDTIVVRSLGGPPLSMPRGSEVPFEPVAITQKTAGAYGLVGLSLGSAGRPGDAGAHEKAVRQSGPFFPPLSKTYLFFAIILPVALFTLRRDIGWLPFVTYLAGLVLWATFPRNSRGRRSLWQRLLTGWWIVPGGLVFREGGLAKPAQVIGLLTANDSSMLVDARCGKVIVHRGNQTFPILADPFFCWAILAGWISTARTPTMAEIESLLHPDKAA